MKDIGAAFSFPFKDPNGLTKILIGGLVTILAIFLIGIPVLYGYLIALTQRVRRGEQYPLPEWSELGVMFISGLKYIVVLLLYSLPMLLIVLPLMFFLFLAGISGVDEAEALGGMTMLLLIFFLIVPYSLFLTWLTPIITVKFADRERMEDGLNLGAVFGLFKTYWLEALIAVLLTIVVDLLSIVGIIFFIVGILFTTFYASLVTFHLYGQIAQSADLAQQRSTPATV